MPRALDQGAAENPVRAKSLVPLLGAAAILTGCASIPTGPSVMVLPGTGMSFEHFQSDDAVCRQWAAQQTGTTTERASTQSTVSGAAIGTALGAAAGAAIGTAAGSPATGAAIGAGGGLLGGTAVGAGRAEGAETSVQRRYDITYMQCMYSKGHQIPVARGSQPAYRSQPAAPAPASAKPTSAPPPPAGTPPPPAGTPPPPPPGSSN
jgi:Glycine-zipper domain